MKTLIPVSRVEPKTWSSFKAGSGPKGQTGRNTVSMGGKGEREEKGERSACGRLVQGQVGVGGAVVRGPGQGGSSELRAECGA